MSATFNPGTRAHRAMAASKPITSRYELAARASSDGFWEWDVKTGVIFYSPRWQAIAGLDPIEFTGTLRHWLDRVHPEDRPRLDAELKAQAAGKAHSFYYEHRMQYADGSWRWVVARGLSDEDGRIVAGSLTDQTEHKTCDPLTSLPNRLFFLDQLQRRLQAAHEKNDWNFAVISLDLDRFKFVNETLGFAAGDFLLVEAAQRLTNVVKGNCFDNRSLVARITDAEFSILLDGVDRKLRALQVAQRIYEELSRSFAWRKKRVSFSAQIGVAMADAGYICPEELVLDADLAKFHAKADGLAKPVCFTSGMRERALKLLQLEAELRNAIEADEMVLYYQPEIDLESNCVVGFEALVRWMHPERGLIPPAEFIPIAEETGLILPLGDWGLARACRQVLDWRTLAENKLDFKVSVNLSAKQFSQPDLVERVTGVLNATGVAGKSLSLEMTESSLMGNADIALKTMQHLRQLGIGLHMDDFGAGYSSLNHLHRFPFDTLKIDRSFIARMTGQKESHEIVNTIVSLARSLKMCVVAEGIETADQAQWLRTLGCQFGQGYYFARPMAADTISAMIASSVSGHQPAMLRFSPLSAQN